MRIDTDNALELIGGYDLVIDGKHIRVTAERDPANLPHKELGVDLVLEATNSPMGFQIAAESARIGGRVVLVGIPDGDQYVPLSASLLRTYHRPVTSSRAVRRLPCSSTRRTLPARACRPSTFCVARKKPSPFSRSSRASRR